MSSNLLPRISEDESKRAIPHGEETGFGALQTDQGPLPLKSLDVQGRIDGLLAQITVFQTFVNVHNDPLEATYVFPLPDRAGVSRFRMEVAGRVVEGTLKERGEARQAYAEAIEAGHRASIAEEERPNVFTMRVGNLPPGESASIELTLTGPLPYADGEVTFRFPLVVAPRYIPGAPLAGPSVGDGVAVDTDEVPDASRISPPRLLPGYPNPVRLGISIDLHDSGVKVDAIRSSLHAVVENQGEAGCHRITLANSERLDRDFILRFRLGGASISSSLSVHPDSNSESQEGTFALLLVPPSSSAQTHRPRDVVFLIDRSGSMGGWKMVAARRALARMVDTLGEADRFNVIAFDDRTERPLEFPTTGLMSASDRNRFRAVEFLAALDARGGTEMADPLEQAIAELERAESHGRDRVLVLVTDGQVGNESALIKRIGPRLKGLRVFTLGIDQAVNEGFLHRLADLGGGLCELVESEHRLDEVMDSFHRRIGAPLITNLQLDAPDLGLVPDSLVPGRAPDLFSTAPLLVLGRYQGSFPSTLTVKGRESSGEEWSCSVPASTRANPAVATAWARGQLRKLEDQYTIHPNLRGSLEKEIVATSLRFGVLCRFTAFVAVDKAEVVNPGGVVEQMTQPVEMPRDWAGVDSYLSYGSGVIGETCGQPDSMRMMPCMPAPAAKSSRSPARYRLDRARKPRVDLPPPTPPSSKDLDELCCSEPPLAPVGQEASANPATALKALKKQVLTVWTELDRLSKQDVSFLLQALPRILQTLEEIRAAFERLAPSRQGLGDLAPLIAEGQSLSLLQPGASTAAQVGEYSGRLKETLRILGRKRRSLFWK